MLIVVLEFHALIICMISAALIVSPSLSLSLISEQFKLLESKDKAKELCGEVSVKQIDSLNSYNS